MLDKNLFKNLNMSTGKKSFNSSNSSQVRTLSLLVRKIHSELSSRTHGVTVIGVGSPLASKETFT